MEGSHGHTKWTLPEFYLPVQQGAAALQAAQKSQTSTFRAAKPQDGKTLLLRCTHTDRRTTYTKQLDGMERRNREFVAQKSVGAKGI